MEAAMSSVNPIPANYPRISPYLCVNDAAAAIDFYVEVLGAVERMRMPGDSPDNIGHAELELGSGMIMLADEFPDMGFRSPKSIGGTPVTVHV
jgi:PhnB protein